VYSCPPRPTRPLARPGSHRSRTKSDPPRSMERCGRSLARAAAVGLLLGATVADGDSTCEQVNAMVGRLNPGFWAPSYVFRSLDVRPGAIHPPNLTRATRGAELVGACDASRFRADSFAWQKPTSDGGDWIATTTEKPMQISINGVPCPLTGIAVTTLGWPSLRLQFSDCPRKTAVEVPLVNVTTGGLKLVHWMCKVAYDSQLCQEAANKLPKSQASTVWPTQEFLDLSPLIEAASKGAARMQVYDNCYESLDWFVINTPVGIPFEEFQMLLALNTVLAPTVFSQVQLQASLVVETVCFPDCVGRLPDECTKKVSAAAAQSAGASAHEDETWEDFVEKLQDPSVQPWSLAIFGLCFLAGSVGACRVMNCFTDPPKKPERRIKQVAVVYHDVPEVSQSFFSSMGFAR